MNIEKDKSIVQAAHSSAPDKKISFFTKIFGKKTAGVFADTVIDQDALNRTSFEVGFESHDRDN